MRCYKLIITGLIFFLNLKTVYSQTPAQIGVHLSPNLAWRSLSVDRAPKDCNCTTSQYKDSLDGTDRPKLGKTAGIHINIPLRNRDWFIQTGLSYNDMGFNRKLEDLQFLDVVHPEIGKITDLSGSVQKDIMFDYRFHYLDIPFIMNYNLEKRRRLYKVNYFLSFGLSANILLHHNFVARLEGFSINGETKFNVKKTGIDASRFNTTLIFGGRFEYEIQDDLRLSVQPLLRVPLLAASKDDGVTYRLYYPGLNVGLNYLLLKKTVK